MIPFNLKEGKHKDHPKAGRYGVIQNAGMYKGFPVTIVDNTELSKDGYSTDKPALVLIHLAEGVRVYSRKKLYDEFLYLTFHKALPEPTYRMFDYTIRVLSKEEIIETLKRVVYDVEPHLQTQTMSGWGSGLLKDDPNRYTGTYVLNDEEEYTIRKYNNSIKFFKETGYYSPASSKEEELLYEEELNFDVYEKAVEVYKLRRSIVLYTNELLDAGDGGKIQAYYQARAELDEKLKTI